MDNPLYNIAVITKENFAGIYNDYYGVLIKYTYTIVRNKELAQDIVADLFCELWNARERITVHTNLQNYLLVSARRKANKQLFKVSNEFDSHHAINLLEEDPHTKFVCKEIFSLLNELLASLAPQKRDIVQLRFTGLTYNEIAAALNITPKKVEYQLNTAICLLHEEIKSKPHFKELAFLLLLPALINEVTIW